MPSAAEIHLWIRSPEEGGSRPEPRIAASRNLQSQRDLVDVLQAYVGVLTHFERGPHGKPSLPGGPEFNLSHSAGGTAIAIARHPVGVDIESPSRKANHQGIASRFFSSDEQAIIESSADQQHCFLRTWVRKEAMCKWAGEGIYRGLRHARSGLGATASYRDRPVWIFEFGDECGLVGALAAKTPAAVKVFVIR